MTRKNWSARYSNTMRMHNQAKLAAGAQISKIPHPSYMFQTPKWFFLRACAADFGVYCVQRATLPPNTMILGREIWICSEIHHPQKFHHPPSIILVTKWGNPSFKIHRLPMKVKRFEQIELPATLLDYFLGSNKSNINREYVWEIWC